MMSRPKIGLALGSGSARGWSHIGIIEALKENGITPDIVCGCSVGALVGAAYIADQMSSLKEWGLELRWQEIAGLLGVGFSAGGLIDSDVFKSLMVKLKIDAPIESYATPFACVATDLETGREIWLREGPVHEAVCASMALPGVFSPVKYSDQWLLDGGLVNPVPVSTCRALGADIIIAVNLNADLVGRRFAYQVNRKDEDKDRDEGNNKKQSVQSAALDSLLEHVPSGIRQSISQITPYLLTSKPSTPGYFNVLANSINIMQDQITRSRLAGEPPHAVLMPHLAHIGLFDFHKAHEAIDEGHACVERALPDLRRLI